MEKKTKPDYLKELDNLEVGHRLDIATGKQQSYRNNALYLKKLKQKQFTIKKINDRYMAMRII